MSNHKEFEARNLDAAISEACAYFGVPRGKLEIEILNDAKTGIFGLVGAKKARIRASKVSLDAVFEEAPQPAREEQPKKGRVGSTPEAHDADACEAKEDKKPKPRKLSTAQPSGRKREPARGEDEAASLGKRHSDAEVRSGEASAPGKKNGQRGKDRGKGGRGADSHETPPKNAKETRQEGRFKNSSAHAGGTAVQKNAKTDSPRDDETVRDEMPELTLATCDQEQVRAAVVSVVQKLVTPIVGEAGCSVEIHGDRVRATVDCGDASGLLVGRDGMTLAAIQYIASRIAARQLGGSFRLHIDAGNYRERHDDRLKELANSLADKVRNTGRAQSTRPLSAYQRRIIHLALENDDTVQTVSKGEGAQRRVVVQLKRQRPQEAAETVEDEA